MRSPRFFSCGDSTYVLISSELRGGPTLVTGFVSAGQGSARARWPVQNLHDLPESAIPKLLIP